MDNEKSEESSAKLEAMPDALAENAESEFQDPDTEEEKMDCDDEDDTENEKNEANIKESESEDQENAELTESVDTDTAADNLPESVRETEATTEANSSQDEESSATKSNSNPSNSNGESHETVKKQSKDADNCYCGKERNLSIVELQCSVCSKWFHEHCVKVPIGKYLPFTICYSFCCKKCNSSGSENFMKRQPNFSQICATTIANLMQKSIVKGKPRQMFSKDKEIIPFIDDNWEYLTPMQRRIKQTWHNTVNKAMLKDTDVFLCKDNGFDTPTFGLVNQDLMKFGPNVDSMQRGPQKFNVDTQVLSRGRSSKRKFFDPHTSGPGGKKAKSDLTMPKLPPNGFPLEHPFNKDGYRYYLAEPDPHAPFQKEYVEGQGGEGKPIPGWLFRVLTPNSVLLALHDSAPQLKISEDRLAVTGEKGYCMARATHGVLEGTWYYEVNIEDVPEGAATRIGWSRALGNLQAPVGYDKFSYSWRSRKGTKFFDSRGLHYTNEGYGQGDTLGFLIHLPSTSDCVQLPPVHKEKPLVKFKSYLYYEKKDETKKKEKNLKVLKGSKMVCYKNGKNMAAMFTDFNEGIYFPAVSLYKSVTVSMNFGPKFKYPPGVKHKSIYELAHETTIQQATTDLLFYTENMSKLSLDNIY